MNKYKVGSFIEIDFDKEVNQGHTGYPHNEISNVKIIRQIIEVIPNNELGTPIYKIHRYSTKILSTEWDINWYDKEELWHCSESDLDKYYKVIEEGDIRLAKYYQDQKVVSGYSCCSGYSSYSGYYAGKNYSGYSSYSGYKNKRSRVQNILAWVIVFVAMILIISNC